jgi:large subunit ribosomal protein L22
MPGVKTNERPGTRAVLRHSRVSAYKVRQVLDLIRGQDVDRAAETLALTEREAARTVGKLLHSAVTNAVHNDGLDAEDLYVSACFADEGATLKRWRPRARGRATRIRKRTSHVTIIVSRMPDDRIARRRAQRAAAGSQRSRRVAGSRRRQARAEQTATADRTEAESEPTTEADELEEFDDGADVDGADVDDLVDDEDDTDDNDTDDEVEDDVDDEADDDDAGDGDAGGDDADAGDEEDS